MASDLDEVFGEEEHSEHLVGQANLQKIQHIHYTAGMREGISAGKESAVQDGFNSGYQKTFTESRSIGRLRGVLRAMAVYIEYKNNNQDHRKHKITSLLLELKKIEEKLMEDVYTSCSPEVKKVEKQDEDKWKHELAEVWSKTKIVCNEIGIDFDKIGLSYSTSSSEQPS